MIARLLIAPIRWYKKYLSPHLGNNCVAIMFEGNGRIDIH